MTAMMLSELVERANALTPEEQLQLIAHLVEKLQMTHLNKPRRKWAEICGAAPYPLFGEDAQAYISRTRSEDTEHRERTLRR